MTGPRRIYQPGETLPVAECRYCGGTGSISVIRRGVLGDPRLASVPCTHRVGAPISGKVKRIRQRLDRNMHRLLAQIVLAMVARTVRRHFWRIVATLLTIAAIIAVWGR